MPFPLDAHVLTVDTNLLHKVDTSNPQNLYSMWTVFARCAESLEQGRRLENICWRLWNATDHRPTYTATGRPRDASQGDGTDVPQLSHSVASIDSVDEEGAFDFNSDQSDPDIVRPTIQKCARRSSRGREHHITADDFEKIVVSILKDKEPFSAPLSYITSPYLEAEKQSPVSSSSFERSGSTNTCLPESSQKSLYLGPSTGTTVVRGFSPAQGSLIRTTKETPRSILTLHPEPASAPTAKNVVSKKQPVLVMGGEQDRPNNARPAPVPQSKRRMFALGDSSEEDSPIKNTLASTHANGLLNLQKKQASQLVPRAIDSAVADDSDTDYVDESAIDDDDGSSDWEDSIENSSRSSMDEKTLFQRVDSKVNLTSRRSLISVMFAQNERASRLSNIASQSTSALPRASRLSQAHAVAGSPNDSDEAPLMMKKGVRSSPLKPINEIPRSTAQPIATAASHSQLQNHAALSPRTTRREMLATELTESMRRNLLWEREQKNSTANAVLKRRHTSHNVANLKQYPEKVHMNKGEDGNPNNQYFQKETHGGYHSKGW
ncbi:uncharacterized protein VDAG_04860 [Verticillium dahliae VdLs.17]|uniref:Uncharacterized protein n=1 Tax=Verticillium dahliae (strain VdLs.17 / ATCC MYA-4575 / FGSC 10137) TaxID=498257 RepID=G2X375_VERDV|nr:uncharacterized protein VDAG_04860 [Verticillium dahliae VdLs.17]EGY23422.1 hypothetical protein VDAG_04860 [Verticillium dahliae VdLs.17]